MDSLEKDTPHKYIGTLGLFFFFWRNLLDLLGVTRMSILKSAKIKKFRLWRNQYSRPCQHPRPSRCLWCLSKLVTAAMKCCRGTLTAAINCKAPESFECRLWPAYRVMIVAPAGQSYRCIAPPPPPRPRINVAHSLIKTADHCVLNFWSMWNINISLPVFQC